MKQPGVQAGLNRRRWRRGLLAGMGLLVAGPGPGAEPSPSQDLFGGTNLPRIEITIPMDGIRLLRRSRSVPRAGEEKPKARVTVREGGRVYTNVTAQLKGYTSFRSIDDRPALTLNFDKLAPGQRFHGLQKISLNNSVQDPGRLNEKLARELFAAAGVPVARADFAEIALNGRALGIYVVTEGFDRAWLRRHFARPEGTLYQGGILQDIDRGLEVNVEGKVPAGAAVERLLTAVREPDPGRRWRALEASVDLDRYFAMAAMETILCHSDSYSMNRNNYRLYHDPGTDRLVFIPHGMDRVLGGHRSGLDLAVVPPVLGMVAKAILSTEPGRRRHVESVAMLLTNVFDPERWCPRVRAWDARMGGDAAEELCGRMAARAGDLHLQLADRAACESEAPLLQFDAEGVARVPPWSLRRRVGEGRVVAEGEDAAVPGRLRLCGEETAGGRFTALLRTRMQLPAGRYRVEGRLDIEGRYLAGPMVLLQLVRNATGRFGYLRRALEWRGADYSFEVAAANAPEEIEFVCDIQDLFPEVRFNGSGLRLVRE